MIRQKRLSSTLRCARGGYPDLLARHAELAGGFRFAMRFVLRASLTSIWQDWLPNLGGQPLPGDPDPLRYQPRAFDLTDLPAVEVLRDFRQATIRLAAVVTVDRRHLKPVDAFPFELDCSFEPVPTRDQEQALVLRSLICQPCRTIHEHRSTTIRLSPSKIAA